MGSGQSAERVMNQKQVSEGDGLRSGELRVKSCAWETHTRVLGGRAAMPESYPQVVCTCAHVGIKYMCVHKVCNYVCTCIGMYVHARGKSAVN